MINTIDTILFDLDGTLLQVTQEVFINTYFAKLGKVFTRLDMDAATCIKAVWSGTKAMVLNDGKQTNRERFWEIFTAEMGLSGEKREVVETACDDFYTNEFDTVKSVMMPNDISKRLVRALAARGYGVVLATNPLFPPCAVTTLLRWIGLEPRDFSLITHYANSTFCKPNPGYYREVLDRIGKTPEQCLMAGNSPTEDMCVGALGVETFLVTDCLENETGADIAVYRHGSLCELETLLMSLPDIP